MLLQAAGGRRGNASLQQVQAGGGRRGNAPKMLVQHVQAGGGRRQQRLQGMVAGGGASRRPPVMQLSQKQGKKVRGLRLFHSCWVLHRDTLH